MTSPDFSFKQTWSSKSSDVKIIVKYIGRSQINWFPLPPRLFKASFTPVSTNSVDEVCRKNSYWAYKQSVRRPFRSFIGTFSSKVFLKICVKTSWKSRYPLFHSSFFFFANLLRPICKHRLFVFIIFVLKTLIFFMNL